MTILHKLTNSKLTRKLVVATSAHVPANWWLGKQPVVREYKGLRYRILRIESFCLAQEIFGQAPLYGDWLPAKVETFADLGCNVGYFTLWLAAQKGRGLKGIAVDANKDCVAQYEWHVKNNGLEQVRYMHGVAGSNEPVSTSFYVHRRSNTVSTETPMADDQSTWKKNTVPCVAMETTWVKQFGDIPCDLLKVDIEGSEVKFLRNEAKFLARVNTIFIEWHKWCNITYAEIQTILAEYGFSPVKILSEDDAAGTAIFKRK